MLRVLALLLLAAAPAMAHTALPTAAQPEGWAYGTDCCSSVDCFALEEKAVIATAAGWYVVEKRISAVTIPYNSTKIRESQDGKFHACAPYATLLRCLYVPPFGL